MNPISARMAANGVHYYPAGSRPQETPQADVYELPRGVDGVPSRITLTARPWYRGGDKAEAVDAGGRALEVTASRRELVVVDAASGITTTLRRDTLDMDVSARWEADVRPADGGTTVARH